MGVFARPVSSVPRSHQKFCTSGFAEAPQCCARQRRVAGHSLRKITKRHLCQLRNSRIAGLRIFFADRIFGPDAGRDIARGTWPCVEPEPRRHIFWPLILREAHRTASCSGCDAAAAITSQRLLCREAIAWLRSDCMTARRLHGREAIAWPRGDCMPGRRVRRLPGLVAYAAGPAAFASCAFLPVHAPHRSLLARALRKRAGTHNLWTGISPFAKSSRRGAPPNAHTTAMPVRAAAPLPPKSPPGSSPCGRSGAVRPVANRRSADSKYVGRDPGEAVRPWRCGF